jgi:hypothetical protein
MLSINQLKHIYIYRTAKLHPPVLELLQMATHTHGKAKGCIFAILLLFMRQKLVRQIHIPPCSKVQAISPWLQSVTNMFDNLTWPSDSPTEENLKKSIHYRHKTLEGR